MPSDCAMTEPKPPRKHKRKRKVWDTAALTNRSRITNGTELLPGVHEQSVWARTMRDTYAPRLFQAIQQSVRDV